MEIKQDGIVININKNYYLIKINYCKNINSNLLAPGPGAYTAFSEFGIYRSKNADKFEATMNSKFNETNTKTSNK